MTDGMPPGPPPAGDGRPPPPRRRRRRPATIDRGPRRLGDSLEDAVAGLRPPADPGPAGGRRPGPSAGALAGLFSRWEEVVGASVARHARPLTLAGGVLSVGVDQPAWATQVRMLAPAILDRVAEVTGETPARLEVRVRPAGKGR